MFFVILRSGGLLSSLPVILCLPRPLPAPVGPVLFIPTILRKACARSRCLPSSPFSSGPQIACSAAILAMRRPCLPLPPPFFRVSSLPLSTRQSSPPRRARCPAGLSLRPSQRTPIFPCLEKKNVCQSRTLVARSLPHHFNPLCTLPTACFRLAAALALPPVAQPAGLRFFRFGRPMASPSAPQMQRNKNRAEWSRAYPCVLTRLYTGPGSHAKSQLSTATAPKPTTQLCAKWCTCLVYSAERVTQVGRGRRQAGCERCRHKTHGVQGSL